MSEEQKTIFISYRRSVSTDAARALFLELRQHSYDVFLDVDSINAGQFDTIILRQIEARAHFLIILTPGSVERCADAGDWLRREIEHAMDTGRNIVPLFYHGFSFAGTDKYLTGKLAELPRYNGLTVPHEYFEAAMDKLRTRFLQMSVQVDVKPTPASDQAVVQRKIADAAAPGVPLTNDDDEFDFYDPNTGKIKDKLRTRFSHPSVPVTVTPALASDQAVVQQKIADASAPAHQMSAEDYYKQGDARQANGDYDGAIADYNEALRLDLQYVEAYNNRGNARLAKGDLDGAIADYTEAIRLNPQYAIAYNNRGIVYGKQHNYKAAIADAQRYIALGGGEQYGDRAAVESDIRRWQKKVK